jgi:hypothetical protein
MIFYWAMCLASNAGEGWKKGEKGSLFTTTQNKGRTDNINTAFALLRSAAPE